MDFLGLDFRDRLLGTAIDGTGGVRYHLRELLGEGGQGWIYKANYYGTEGIWVVVKLLRPEAIQSEALKRFEREANVLRMLGSASTPNPHIVRFHDYGFHYVPVRGDEISLPFIVLEYVEGQTLAEVVQAHGGFGLPVTRARMLMGQVAKGLQGVHELRVIHRDLKPSNILLTHAGGHEIAKVTDFGLVKLPDVSAHRTTSVAGASLGYAPPEQYEMGNLRVGVQTDVFAFAAILYEVLCGTEAFPCRAGDNPLRLMARMLNGERPALARVRATVPPELRDRPDLTAALDREFARSMSADPALRHASIPEFWQAVEPLLREAAHRGSRGPEALADLSTPAPAPVAMAVAAPMPEWRIVGKPMTGERLRSGVLADGGRAVVAIGIHGLYRFASGTWSTMHLPQGVDSRFIRGLLRMPSGDLLLYGDNAFAMLLSPRGATERIALRDQDMTLLGACADARGLAFAGERLSSPVGIVVQVPAANQPTVLPIPGTTRLHDIARLGASALVACGTLGALVEIAGGAARDIPWGRTGHLFAAASASSGVVFIVGSGGHALRISAVGSRDGHPDASLESVQTTRDLTGVHIDSTGCAWATGGQGRLLQRRDGVWTRIPLEPGFEGHIVLVSPRSDAITVLCEDGTVLEGRGFG